MTVKLSTGKTFDALWIGGPTIATKSVIMEIVDSRKVSEIAVDFEGVDHITAEDTAAGQSYAFDGYSQLLGVVKSGGNVQITLRKEG